MQHVDITDPNIHEPKGISTATVGQVYIANGAGGGTWLAPSFGGLKVVENTNSFTPVAADIAQYKQLTVANGVTWQASESSNITLGTDSITLNGAGVYRIEFWGVISTAAATGTQFGIKFALDGGLDGRTLKIQKNSSGADLLACSAFGLVSATPNQVLTLYASSSAATSFILSNAGFSVHKVS